MTTIELDCAPFCPRPDTYLPGVIEGTGLTPDDFVITSKLFGCWEFTLKSEKKELYDNNKDKIADRVKSLYEKGSIRYGSW